ncbi:putative plastidic glucose transporter 2 [Canna indica]|uniref:Plastidic glucose transporter 2 n=1 Tax=Canna indica TaxID=4628 RepID=A0AAQ3K2M9_9LILI|nr:putative plastidic glucose transporter 2 [Canna indica]
MVVSSQRRTPPSPSTGRRLLQAQEVVQPEARRVVGLHRVSQPRRAISELQGLGNVARQLHPSSSRSPTSFINLPRSLCKEEEDVVYIGTMLFALQPMAELPQQDGGFSCGHAFDGQARKEGSSYWKFCRNGNSNGSSGCCSIACLQPESSWLVYLSVGRMLISIVAFALGAGPVPGLLLPESFPNKIRAKAMALCMSVHWVLEREMMGSRSFTTIAITIFDGLTYPNYTICNLLNNSRFHIIFDLVIFFSWKEY